MKWFFFIIVILHGLIHILGFLKAFQFAEISQLIQPISKPSGILWLASLLLLVVSSIQFIGNSEVWWVAALAGVIVSQILIITFWHDAKFGTIPNTIILIVAIIAFADWNFTREVKNEIVEMFAKNPPATNRTLTEDMIKDLPQTVQRWLRNSGTVGKEMIHSVRLKQKGGMKMKPEQESWYKAEAEQYFTINNPAFIWKTKVDMMPLVYFAGWDHFADGKGKMLIKILSLINVVNSSDSEKMNQGTLQRYLAEIVWFPTAAISDYIKWEEIDSISAKATMNYKGSTGSGTFYFNSNGDFTKFSTMRYMGSGLEVILKEWVITVTESENVNGVKIPTKMEVSWKLEPGDFTWFKIEVFDVEYNKPELWN
jgi:hypothetical protein